MKPIYVLVISLIFTAGCGNHHPPCALMTSNYNAPNITFDNPPNSGQDCAAVFTDHPYKMVITCVYRPLCGLGCSQ